MGIVNVVLNLDLLDTGPEIYFDDAGLLLPSSKMSRIPQVKLSVMQNLCPTGRQ
jgi:hypothetical protein